MHKQTAIVSMLVVVGSAAMIVGCGGGGQSTVPAGGPAPQKGMSSTTFQISIPTTSTSSVKRSPNYISAGTQSIAITVAVGSATPGAPTVANLTSSSPNCSSTPAALVCTVSVAAPIGSDTFGVSLYSGTNATGSVLSKATMTGTVTASTANTIPIVLNGVVANVQISVTDGNNLIPGGYATTLPVVVTAEDASGNIIVGGYANPITLTNSDTSGATTLSTTTLSSSSTSVTLAYCPTAAQSAPSGCAIPSGGPVTIGATAASPAPTVSPGTFQYIADRFFGYNHTREYSGSGSVTITTYNASGTPSPNPSTWSYTISDALTIYPYATFDGVPNLSDSHDVYTYTQTSPVTSASPEVSTEDKYRADTLTGTGAILYWYFQNDVDVNSGTITSPFTGDVVGTTTILNTWPNPGQYQYDVLPHTATSWSDNLVPFSQTWTGAETATELWNADGSESFSETSPSVFVESQAVNGPGTSFSGQTGVTTTVSPPSPAAAPSVIPVAEETTSPSPGPTTLFTPPDWYPNGGQLPNPVFTESYALSYGAIPGSCNVPSTIATNAWALTYTQTWLRTYLFQYRVRTETSYLVPGGIGQVCATYTQTSSSYRFNSGVISSQTVITYVYGVTSSSNLSVKRQPR